MPYAIFAFSCTKNKVNKESGKAIDFPLTLTLSPIGGEGINTISLTPY
jgi:hypothetical protein